MEIVHCTEVITNDDAPTLAIRQKKDSSLVVALKMLKEDADAAGFVSAGSTGAVLTGALLRVGRIRGISRPAVCPALPTAKGGKVLIIDAGANAECKPVNLCHFALMGTAYARAMGVKEPRVGLVTNGTEEHKGDPLHQESYHLLKSLQGIRFVGNVEGRDIMSGDIDVAVCDGFSGNIALKTAEGTALAVMSVIKQNIKASSRRNWDTHCLCAAPSKRSKRCSTIPSTAVRSCSASKSPSSRRTVPARQSPSVRSPAGARRGAERAGRQHQGDALPA